MKVNDEKVVKAVHKPIRVEAMQWAGDITAVEIMEWAGIRPGVRHPYVRLSLNVRDPRGLVVWTPHTGFAEVPVGTYLVKFPTGVVKPMSPEEFEAEYERQS